MKKKKFIKTAAFILSTGIILSCTQPMPYSNIQADASSLYKNIILTANKSNIGITSIDDIPEEYTTEIKVPGKTTITKISSTKNSITIKWKKAKKSHGYIISRSTKKHSGYKEIANIKNSSQTSYTDKNLKKNKKYYYYMKAYASKDNISVYGKESKITGIKTKK